MKMHPILRKAVYITIRILGVLYLLFFGAFIGQSLVMCNIWLFRIFIR